MAHAAGLAALEAVLRPLEFAARDDFAHAERVQNLERSVHAAAEVALAAALPREVRTVLASVRDAFEKPLDAAGRRRAVERALRRLAPFATPAYAEAALAASPASLPGVGPKRAEVMARRGLDSVLALLFHLPSRYDDRRSEQKIGALEVGQRATFTGKVLGCGFAAWRGGRGRGGRMFEAVLGDETGTVNLKWFRGGEAISRVVVKDAQLRVTGEVKRYRFSKELQHPEVEKVDPAEETQASRAQVVPDYSAPEGVHPRGLRRAIACAVSDYSGLVPAWLPEKLARARGLPSPGDALRAIHVPDVDADILALQARRTPHHERLILEELYLLELGLALRRARKTVAASVPISSEGPRTRAALRALPFELTGAQHRVWHELRQDLARPHPMHRLLEGEVGSGKTVVAYLAAVAAAESGHQTALMAPTELLAEQHERTLTRLAAQHATDPLRIERLSASTPRTHADLVRAELASGDVDLVVGTHALLEEGVAFRSLGLVVVDEQQRFGVLQRAALGGKAAHEPHTLVMTATPIPRTLALTLYGDLDLSVLDELPPGRQPVRTVLFREGEGRQVADLLRETVARGEQVYVVYPLVEESEKSDLRAATESAQRIRAAFPKMQVDLVHGRLDATARAAAMARFESGETQVLVSTTVVEVGVDVANATLMIVEHAERFGLAQLHQLRGRIGRGTAPGTCALVARGVTEGSEARLAALLATTDGFQIAEADLKIRGPGEFLGTRQHGRLPDLRIADLARDVKLVSVAREAALETVRRDPTLARDAELVRAVRARWGSKLALADVG
ncbi:MAG TPA: ATP-dependent DNA helicase RecG [Myxococcota bacterium]|nr:ATP-dependent DNA helicase RecG [Myxococcota bacterium]